MARVKYPSVSVVVCCYNGADVLPGALKALSKQTWKGKLEIIVVDDGSHDDTAKVAKSFKVRLIRNKKNIGLAASRNVGARAAKGDIILYTDDDCRPQPSWVSRICDEYKNDSVLAVGGKVTSKEDNSYVRRYLKRANPLRPLENTLSKSSNIFYRLGLYLKGIVTAPKSASTDKRRSVYSLVGANMSFRKHALESVGYFDERFRFGGEEEDIFKRINQVSKDGVIYSPRPDVIHHFEPGLKDTLRRSKAYGKGNARMFYKYPGSYPVLYPLPFAIVLSPALGLIHPLLALSPLVLVPVIYTRWLIVGIKEASLESVSYSYVQFAQEIASNAGLFRGLVEFRQTFHTPSVKSAARMSTLAYTLKSSTNYLTPPAFWSALLLAATLLARIFDNQALSLLSSVGLVVVPGFLLAMTLQPKESRISRLIALGIPFGAIWMMVVGLFSAITMPLLGVERPLDSTPVTAIFTVSLILLNVWVYLQNKTIDRVPVNKPNVSSVMMYVIAGLVPVLSASGALMLNSGRTNTISILAFILACIGIATAVSFRKRLSKCIYPVVLFTLSLGVLWSYSLRSSSLFGWDIQQEFSVFLSTLHAGVWHLGQAHSAYDAMLSITIFPTLLSNISGLAPLAIFKVLSPILFSALPVLVYFIYRRFVNHTVAFLGALLMIVQFTYMQQFSGLVRQQLAFLMFATLIYILVMNWKTWHEKSDRTTKAALGLLVFGMVVSHYTTTYITIILALIPFLIIPAYRLWHYRSEPKSKERRNYIMRLSLALWLIFLAISWYVPLTQSGGILTKLADGSSLQKIQKSLSAGPDKNYSTIDSTDEYLSSIGSKYRQERPYFEYYTGADNSALRAIQINDPSRHTVLRAATDATQYIVNIGLWTAGLIGACWLLFKSLRPRTNATVDQSLALIIGMAGLIFVIAHIVPGVEGLYNVTRLNQQLLILLALPSVLVILKLLQRLKAPRQNLIMASTLIFVFAASYGILNQAIGGSATANLNNSGSDYQRFYIQDAETSAAKWLDKQSDSMDTVYADRYASLRLTVPTSLNHGLMNDVTPATIAKGSYVYLSNSNVNDDLTYGSGGGVYMFTTPMDFLEASKTKLYTNNESEIYR